MPEDTALFNANDGLTGRDGGPYLDEEEAREAEIRRARAEKREPDLDNPPASAGIVLLTPAQALANAGVNNLPSQDGNTTLGAAAALKAIEDDPSNLLVSRAVLPAEGIDESEEPVDLSTRTALATDGTSRDEDESPVELPASDSSDEFDDSGNFNPQTPTA